MLIERISRVCELGGPHVVFTVVGQPAETQRGSVMTSVFSAEESKLYVAHMRMTYTNNSERKRFIMRIAL